jgi:hypothetical protein
LSSAIVFVDRNYAVVASTNIVMLSGAKHLSEYHIAIR